MEFGEKMTVMRNFRKMSAHRLVELSGLTDATLSLIANGTITPASALERKIRVALGWPVELDPLLETIHNATYKSGEAK